MRDEAATTAMPVMLSPDGRRVGIVTNFVDGTVEVRDTHSGTRQFDLPVTDFNAILLADRFMSGFSPDSRHIAWRQNVYSKDMLLIDDTDGKVKHSLSHRTPVTLAAFSADGNTIATSCKDDPSVRIWTVADGKLHKRLIGHAGSILSIERWPVTGRYVTGATDGTARIWDVQSERELKRFEVPGDVIRIARKMGHSVPANAELGVDHIKVSPLKDVLLVARLNWEDQGQVKSADVPIVWNPSTGHTVKLDVEMAERKLDLSGHRTAFSPDGKRLIWNAAVWDTATGKKQCSLNDYNDVFAEPAFTADGKFVSIGAGDRIQYRDSTHGAEVCAMLGFQSGNWAVINSDGRLDHSDLAAIEGFHWVFPDDPFRPLAPEIFLRDYYEPRLLSRILKGEKFADVRPLSDLNRVQPTVGVTQIESGKTDDEVVVTIAGSPSEGSCPREGKDIVMRTDVYDLRLFREGQLVGRWPEPQDGGVAEFDPDPTSADDMRKWRDLNRVKPDVGRVESGADGKMIVSFPVRLPSRSEPGPVVFTAYAFNEDRVKSETAKFTYQAPVHPAVTKPRAYLICVGVSACQTPAWDLTFAAKDAEVTADALGKAIKDTGQYDVVPVVLTSQYAADGRTVTSANSTKVNLRAVLDLLAGKSVGAEVRDRLPNASELHTATPDDLVLISFSGHGYTDTRGALYLIPFDVGSSRNKVSDAQSRCISSGELSAWLRGIDAGETVLIVDACHSAAAIAEPGFKPGPLGNRGLGQLAYDKGMRVLAAAQGNDVALESRKVKQGLLTYALVRDGLEHQRAAKDGTITLGGLLAYAAERVPSLYEEVVAGKVKDATGEAAKDVGTVPLTDSAEKRVQRPELFDYAKKRPDIPLRELK